MRARKDCTAEVASAPAEPGELVSIFVPDDHPLLQLHRALDWAAIQAVMVKHWRAAGKNVDGGPGRWWPVSLYVPLLVLMRVKSYHARQMEEYVNESVVARRFVGQAQQTVMQVRDHANIARAAAALGADGWAEVNQVVMGTARQLGFTGSEILSSDTTVQEPRIGYPNEPGIVNGLAQRCERALVKLKNRGVKRAQAGIETAKEIYRRVKQHHLWAKTKEERQQMLRQIVRLAEQLLAQTQAVIQAVGQTPERVKQSAVATLQRMGQVGRQLLPQIKQWIKTGQVASEKIIHVGLTEARAIVTDKAGRRVRFGFKWLIHRLRGGYVWGRRGAARANEYQMPLESLADYQALFGRRTTPKLLVYDRGGRCAATVKKLKQAKVKKVGIPPCGQGAWLVGEKDQARVRSQRAKTEGSIGRLKSQKYGFSHRQERRTDTQTAIGQQILVSVNLNTLLGDLVNSCRNASVAAA